VQAFLSQEPVFVELSTDDDGSGLGCSSTIGTGGSSVVVLLRDHLLPRLVGRDSRLVEAIWRDLFAATRATTVGAITSLALAAVDTALWDLECRRAAVARRRWVRRANSALRHRRRLAAPERGEARRGREGRRGRRLGRRQGQGRQTDGR
jgi:hypothetical protein